MAINAISAIEWTSIVTSTIEFLALMGAFIILICKRVPVEKTFSLIFVILTVAVLLGLVQSYAILFINFTEENKRRIGVILVLMQSKSVGLIHIAFNMCIAKTYSLVLAFSRRRLNNAIEFLQKSN